MDIEKGTSSGPCPFTVNGIIGDDFETMSPATMKAIAIQHLEGQGKILAIGHKKEPVPMYDNPQAYPQMFPWLFPYGSIGQHMHKGVISESKHKSLLLLYYDKRFQTDPYFPIISYNHDQIRSAGTGSFLTASKANFPSVVHRLQNIIPDVLIRIINQLINSEHVKPSTDDEKLCFSLLRDTEHVGGHVSGSITSRKAMRNEMWSMTMFAGFPNWFITITPADNRHPLCIYYADNNREWHR
jgi:hypothetical protein